MIEYVSWLWEPMFGEVVQAWIPLAVAAAGLAMGAYQGHQKQQAAERKDQYTGNLAALDTLYSPYVARTGVKPTFTDRGAGAIGGGFQGALSGYQTGAGIEQGMNAQDLAESQRGMMMQDRAFNRNMAQQELDLKKQYINSMNRQPAAAPNEVSAYSPLMSGYSGGSSYQPRRPMYSSGFFTGYGS